MQYNPGGMGHTLLELQHFDGTEKDPAFSYRTGIEFGFLGLDMCTQKNAEKIAGTKETDFLVSSGITTGVTLYGPDGYLLRCY